MVEGGLWLAVWLQVAYRFSRMDGGRSILACDIDGWHISISGQWPTSSSPVGVNESWLNSSFGSD